MCANSGKRSLSDSQFLCQFWTEPTANRAGVVDLCENFSGEFTASGHTDPKPEAPEKEDTAHEEN